MSAIKDMSLELFMAPLKECINTMPVLSCFPCGLYINPGFMADNPSL